MAIRSQSAPDPEVAPRTESAKKELKRRLVEALLDAIEEEGEGGGGYSTVTVADIVRHAQTSKRTFYEVFVDKDACLLAAYKGLSELTIRGIEAAFLTRALGETTWDARIHAAAQAYVMALGLRPIVTRTFLLEIHVAGSDGLKARRAVHLRFASLLERLVDLAREENPKITPLAKPLAIALVGGINELALVSLESDRGGKLKGVAETVAEAVRRMLNLPAA